MINKLKMSRICLGNLLFKRQMHTNAELVQNCKEIRNRNPRNLERLRIARKPIGYALEKPGHSYWHKLVISISGRYVTAEIHHFENGAILSASSQEWGLKTQLYSTLDAMAFKSVGSVLAQRCLESGISEIYVNEKILRGSKTQSLVDALKEGGIILEEPARYKYPNRPTFRMRPEKPWETFE